MDTTFMQILLWDDNSSLYYRQNTVNFFSKKQTKYRLLFLKIQTTISKCHNEKWYAEIRCNVLNMIAQKFYFNIITLE